MRTRSTYFPRQSAAEQHHVTTWTIQVHVFESPSGTSAHAVLKGEGGSRGSVDAYGQAAVHPAEAPEISDEVAVSRALRQLSERLSDAADIDRGIYAGTGRLP